MPSQLVAIIFGAGPDVGDSVADALVKQVYKVAVGSRNPKRDNVPERFYPFTVDFTKPDSIKTAFQTIITEIGPPNVVILNGTYSLIELGCIQIEYLFP